MVSKSPFLMCKYGQVNIGGCLQGQKVINKIRKWQNVCKQRRYLL